MVEFGHKRWQECFVRNVSQAEIGRAFDVPEDSIGRLEVTNTRGVKKTRENGDRLREVGTRKKRYPLKGSDLARYSF